MKNQEKLNKMCPAFGEAGILFGDRLVAIITLANELKSNMATFKTTYDKLLAQFKNKCLAAGGVAMSVGTTDQLKTVNTLTYVIDGKLYTKAAADPVGAWTLGHTGLGNSEEAYYLLCVNAAGTFSTVEGTIVAAGAGCVPPDLPVDVAPVALLKVVTGAGGVFVPDTTALNDVGITVTYTDISELVASNDAPVAAPSISAAAVKTVD